MPQQTFAISGNVHLVIRACHHRITVTGWEDARSVVVDAAARQENDTITVENAHRATVRVPRTAAVTIQDCEADVRVEDIAGRVEIRNIDGAVILRGLAEAIVGDVRGDLVAKGVASLQGEGRWDGDVALRGITERLQVNAIAGDASLTDLGAVTIEEINGDASLHGVRGAIHLGHVEGDLNLRDAAGDLTLAHIAGDFVASGLQGDVDAPEIDGDAVVSLRSLAGAVLRAKGDVVLNLPDGANADVELDAPHGDLICSLGLSMTEQDEHHLRGTLGSGGTRVQAESLHADIIVRAGPTERVRADYEVEFKAPFMGVKQDFAELGRRIAEETRESVAESLAGYGFHRHGRHHAHHRTRREDSAEGTEMQSEDGPRGAAAGTPERKAILDAIARGEMSVDDAIRKIRGEA